MSQVGDVQIVSLTDRDQWMRCAKLPAHAWHYASALSASGIEPRLAVVDAQGSRMTMAFFERLWNGTRDLATIYGLSGALIEPVSEAPLAAWYAYAKTQGWIAGYVQLSPYSQISSVAKAQLVNHSAVFLIDIADTDPMPRASRTIRRKIAAADADGVQLVLDRSALAPRLVDLYPKTWERLGLGKTTLSAATLQGWAEDPDALLIGASVEGRIVAVYLFLISAPYAESHMLAYELEGRELIAWLISKAVPMLRAKGVRTLNLGGGAKIGDGIYEFKSRFGVAPTPLQSVRQIYDRARYEKLCLKSGVTESAFFPAYRSGAGR